MPCRSLCSLLKNLSFLTFLSKYHDTCPPLWKRSGCGGEFQIFVLFNTDPLDGSHHTKLKKPHILSQIERPEGSSPTLYLGRRMLASPPEAKLSLPPRVGHPMVAVVNQ